MAIRSYKKQSAKKNIKRRLSSKKSSSKHSSKKSSNHKTRVKSHYRMRGMGNLLQMYGGASAELEAEHNACLVKYKELIDSHEKVKQLITDMRLESSSTSEINEQISNANNIREEIRNLVDGAGKCKEKQAALLESLKEVTGNVSGQLNDEILQAGGGFADLGARLDSAGAKFSAGSKVLSSKLSSGIKSASESIKNKYSEYNEIQQAKKDAQEKIQLRKLLAKHGSSVSGMTSDVSLSD